MQPGDRDRPIARPVGRSATAWGGFSFASLARRRHEEGEVGIDTRSQRSIPEPYVTRATRARTAYGRAFDPGAIDPQVTARVQVLGHLGE